MIKKTVTTLSILGVLAITSITASANVPARIGRIDKTIPRAANSSVITDYVKKLNNYKVPMVVNMTETDGETLNYCMINSAGNQRSDLGSVNDSNRKRTTAACYSQVKAGYDYKLKLSRSTSNFFFGTDIEGTWSPDNKHYK